MIKFFVRTSLLIVIIAGFIFAQNDDMDNEAAKLYNEGNKKVKSEIIEEHFNLTIRL